MATKALIIGGGIGGLATAVALGRIGIEATVFERSPAIHEVGAGLSLWSNAVKALRRLGLDEAVVYLGSVLERAAMRTHDGELLDATAIGDLSRRAGAPSLCVHRADLQRVLRDALPPDRLQTARECVGFDQDDRGVTARFADRHAERGDLLIGADGLHSKVREQLHGPAEPRYAGYAAWRGIAPFVHPDLPPDASLLALGPGMQVGVFPCGPGRTYWFATRNEPLSTQVGHDRIKADVLGAVRGWYAPIPAVIEATPDAAILKNPILDRPPTRDWGRGLATFVGDAIHPTTPNLGQGACQALEDAVVLADALRNGGELASCLRDYERRRIARTTMVVDQSWRLGRISQWQNPMAVRFRSALFRSTMAHRRGVRMFEALLGYDLPDLPANPLS